MLVVKKKNNISNELSPNKNIYKLATSKYVKNADNFFSSLTSTLNLQTNVSWIKFKKKKLKYSVTRYLDPV